MPEVNIVKPFDFTHQDGSVEKFVPGSYDVDEGLANHWYIQAHTDKPPRARPRPGTPTFVRQQEAFEADQREATSLEDQIAFRAAEMARAEFRDWQKKQGGRRRLRMPAERVEGRANADQELVSQEEQDARETQLPPEQRGGRRRISGEAEEGQQTQTGEADQGEAGQQTAEQQSGNAAGGQAGSTSE